LRFLKKSSKGSFTVEATIVFSTVIFSIIAVIFICLLLYQQALIQSLASRTAERGAMIWGSPDKDMYIGRITQADMKDTDPYWRFIDTKKESREKRIADYIDTQIDSFSVLPRVKDNSEPKINITDFVIYKKINVTITERYEIPAFSFLKMFGIDNKLEIKGRSEAVINEPVEFIRNTDFVMDTGREIDRKVFNGKLSSFKDGLVDSIAKILEKVKGLFNK